MFIHALDLIGVFAFAFIGARNAKINGFNSAGVLSCAFLAALGGGTIRSVILNQTPFYFDNYDYIITVTLGMAAALLTYTYYASIKSVILFLDTVGVITFAYLGASAAIAAGLGVVASVVFATLTACGGVLCDLLARTAPHALSRPTLYLSPAILTGLACWLGSEIHLHYVIASTLVSVAFVVQLIIAYSYHHTLRLYTRHMLDRLNASLHRPLPESE